MSSHKNIAALKHAIDQLRVVIESEFRGLSKSANKIAEEFNIAVVAPIPTWEKSHIASDDDVQTMEDDAFIKMRLKAARQKDVIKRMAATAALVRVVASVIAEKQKRIKALEGRIKSGNAEDAETAVATQRIIHINQIVKALQNRLMACISDFAVARHNALTAVCSATTAIEALFPNGDDTVASLFCGARADAKNAIRILAESEDRIKAGRRVMHKSLAFGGRSKK